MADGVTVRRGDVMRSRSGELQNRHDASFAWKTEIDLVRELPGLRGSWKMNSFDNTGALYGFSGQTRTLTYNGNPQYNYVGLVSFLWFDGTGDYLDRADEGALDITGTETTVATAARGLTMGCWVFPQSTGAEQAIIGKWNENGVNERSYLIDLTATNNFRARISTAGTAATIDSVTSSVTVTDSVWYYVEMTFDPSTRLAINVNGTIDELVAGVGASVYSGAANFVVGARDNGASALLTGRVSLAWLCAAYHTDTLTQAVYQHTRALYGR